MSPIPHVPPADFFASIVSFVYNGGRCPISLLRRLPNALRVLHLEITPLEDGVDTVQRVITDALYTKACQDALGRFYRLQVLSLVADDQYLNALIPYVVAVESLVNLQLSELCTPSLVARFPNLMVFNIGLISMSSLIQVMTYLPVRKTRVSVQLETVTGPSFRETNIPCYWNLFGFLVNTNVPNNVDLMRKLGRLDTYDAYNQVNLLSCYCIKRITDKKPRILALPVELVRKLCGFIGIPGRDISTYHITKFQRTAVDVEYTIQNIVVRNG